MGKQIPIASFYLRCLRAVVLAIKIRNDDQGRHCDTFISFTDTASRKKRYTSLKIKLLAFATILSKLNGNAYMHTNQFFSQMNTSKSGVICETL